MLTRLRRLLRPRPAPLPSVRLEPVVDTVAWAPPHGPPRDPDPDAASNHYPPLDERLPWDHPDAARFLDEMQPGDEVRSFCSRREEWHGKGGRMGVALVRSGRVVRSVVTVLN